MWQRRCNPGRVGRVCRVARADGAVRRRWQIVKRFVPRGCSAWVPFGRLLQAGCADLCEKIGKVIGNGHNPLLTLEPSRLRWHLV